MKHVRLEVRDNMGKFVVAGTIKECADAIGVAEGSLWHAIEKGRNRNYKQYQLKDITVYEKDEGWMQKSENIKAARQWDEFITPVRERFGVPVYKAKEGKR